MKTFGLMMAFLLGVGTAHADSNPTITDIVDALNGKTLVCTSGNGNVIQIKGVSGELEMSAKFATDGYDAGNDDGPPDCNEKICEEDSSTDSDSGGMSIVNVSKNKQNQTLLDLNFGDDSQNNYLLYLPSLEISNIEQGKSFSANGVYVPRSDNRKTPAGGVKIKTLYNCSI